jgi:hypothetical protein
MAGSVSIELVEALAANAAADTDGYVTVSQDLSNLLSSVVSSPPSGLEQRWTQALVLLNADKPFAQQRDRHVFAGILDELAAYDGRFDTELRVRWQTKWRHLLHVSKVTHSSGTSGHIQIGGAVSGQVRRDTADRSSPSASGKPPGPPVDDDDWPEQ